MKHVAKPALRSRAAAASAGALLALTGLAACGDSAGPEQGEVTTEDLQSLEEDLGAMEERIGTLEEDPSLYGDGEEVVDEGGTGDDAGALVGQEGTVSAAVSEVVTSSDAGSAFRIGGQGGQEIAVISTTAPSDLQLDDVVRVSGTVVQIRQDTFEEDFGVNPDDLFDDAEGFFEEEEGNIAISADSVEVLQEQAEE